MRIAVTGRRDIKGFDKPHIEEEIIRVFVKLKGTVGLTGLAQGSDLVYARVLHTAEIPIEAYVPYWEQASEWPDGAADMWAAYLLRADKRHLTNDVYRKGIYFERNTEMMTSADAAIAIWEGDETGGNVAGT